MLLSVLHISVVKNVILRQTVDVILRQTAIMVLPVPFNLILSNNCLKQKREASYFILLRLPGFVSRQ